VIKKVAQFEKQNYVFLFFVLFGLIFVRYCYYGFEYYYQLDDYIQYRNYATSGQGFVSLVKGLGLLSARPLAGLLDIFVWTHFYGYMLAAVGIISAMYAASAVFLHRVFSKHFGTGYLFFVVYALLPLGFEGTYWVSASSRIVVGLFFASLSFYYFDLWCAEGRKRNLVLFAVFQFAAFCLYEQILLFSGALTLIIMLRNAKGFGKRRACWGFFMFANAILYLGLTKLMPAGVYGTRAELFLPWQEGYFEHCFLSAGKQVETAFVDGTAATWGKGLVRGFKFFVSEPNVIYTLIILALCYAFFEFAKKARRENISFFAELFSGIFLALAPLLLFFVLKTPWFGIRNVAVSFCGLALIADALFDLVFGRLKSGKTAETVIVSVLAFLCCIASISELHDYRETTIADTKIAKAVAKTFENTDFDENDSIWLLNVDPTYVSDGNFYYHEHNYGVTSSAWALTGAISAISGRTDLPFTSLFIPISEDVVFAVDESDIGKTKAFCYTGEGFAPVSIVSAGSSAWNVISSSGELLGTMQYSYGGLFLKIK